MCLCCSVTFSGVQILFVKCLTNNYMLLTKYFFRLISKLFFPRLLNLMLNDMVSLYGYKYEWPLASFPSCWRL